MRILHTADWHLGKMFYGEYLTDEQAYVLKQQFLPLLKSEHIDAVVLAGDVYDRSLPPAAAVELFDEISTKVTAEMHVPFFVISGNHDSAARLSFGSRLLARQQLYIAGDLDKLTGPVVLDDAAGPVAFIMLPYAEPADVRQLLGDDSIRDHQTALSRLAAFQSKGTAGLRTVCLAHVFASGGTASDSERPLSLGGTECIDTAVFAPYSYTALGHLHGPQQAGRANIRYAGSLMKYSFSEAKQKKGAVIADLAADGTVTTTHVPFVPRKDVRILTGTFAEIMEREDGQTDDFILARVDDTQPILDGMGKLRRKYPNALALETPQRQMAANSGDRNFDLRQASDQVLFDNFAAAIRPDQPLSEKETAYLQRLWETLQREEGSDDQ